MEAEGRGELGLGEEVGRVEFVELGVDEETIFADELAIEVDFAAAVFGALDGDEVPVDLGAVAVVGLVGVGLARGEVEATRDFLVEEDIAHGLEDVWVEADGKFPDGAGSRVGIEDFGEFLLIARAGL